MDIVLRTLCNYWRKSLFFQNSKMYDGITAEMKSVRMLAYALQRLYLRPLLCGFSVTLAWTFSGPGLGRLMLHCWGDLKMQTVQHVRSHYFWLSSLKKNKPHFYYVPWKCGQHKHQISSRHELLAQLANHILYSRVENIGYMPKM